jgi:orotidine-5'-phosphate decarboxylase
MIYNIDKLFESVEAKGHVCVGLDTCADYVPPSMRKNAASDAEAVLAFNRALIDATFEAAACYKVQIAYYEEMGLNGLSAYSKTLKYIRDKGGIIIADIKRGDIADTAIRYANAHFSGDFEADFVTLSPYMGMDSIEPWAVEAEKKGKGAFVLMRTSNQGMKDFQYLEVSKEKRLYNIIGDKLTSMAEKRKGSHDYGIFGAVVGCTEKDEAAEIRKNYPRLFFLIPGYGAQGGGAEDAALLLRNGNGGVVNASRSIIRAWKNESDNENAGAEFAAEAALKAAVKMRDEIRARIGTGE